ncbi:MAG: hypothetical protein PHG13_00730 [Candidatus Pacebacteria bacterium]|nr:hypothetical protein [Candidatus Paceibacterota bacterium]MDD5722082.1 hypothetical protein [Candidatus Paceibacterota bacterium]
MEQTLLGYFFKKIGFYALDFIQTYFINGHHFVFGLYQSLFSKLEHRTGLIVNFRYLAVPLWQEYSLAAYFVSIPYRIMKMFLGVIVLILLTLVFSAIYICLAFLPFYLIFKTIFH